MKFEVGKPFPGPVPAVEGATMELWADGLVVIIQMPGLTRQERRAFQKSFDRYSYLESSTPVPVAIWIFDFPSPHGSIDCNFNVQLVKPEYVDNYLTLENGQVKNAVTFYLLDGHTLNAIKLVGLQGMEYSNEEYGQYLDAIYQYSSEELLKMGKVFRKG